MNVDAKTAVLEIFRTAFPRKLDHVRRIGVEEEFAVVRPTGEVAKVARIFPRLLELGWEAKNDPVTGALVGATQGGVEIGTDVGIGTLEVGFKPSESLFVHLRERTEILGLIDSLLLACSFRRLTDYSVQPVTVPAFEHWAPKGRAGFFRQFFHPAVHPQTASAASQCHLDAALDEVVPAIEVFLSLAGVFIAFTANSPVWAGKLDPEGMLASRQRFWDRFTANYGFCQNVRAGLPARTPEEARVGKPPHSLEELAVMLIHAPFIVRVDGNRIEAPNAPFETWCRRNGNLPAPETFHDAFKDHMGTVWWDARPRDVYGTVEVRPCCQTLNGLAHHALALGLMENLVEALDFVRRHAPYRVWRAHRLEALKCGMRDEFTRGACRAVLPIANRGLEGRGFKEEELLLPLAQRVSEGTSPGHHKLEVFNHGGLPDLLGLIIP